MRPVLFLALGVVLFSACDTADIGHDGTPGPHGTPGLQAPGGPTSTAAEARTLYADPPFTFDAVVSEVSRRHRGLKGVVGTGQGEAVQVLLGPGALAAPGAVVRELALALGRPPAAVRAAAAPIVRTPHPRAFGLGRAPAAERPDFHVLYDIRIGLRRFLFETDLVTMLDIDDAAGRVLVGTRTAEDAARVRTMMEEGELAVTEFVQAEPAVALVGAVSALESAAPRPHMTAAATASLRSLRNDRFRPLIAGAHTRQEWRDGRRIRCTQGPVVRYGDGTYGFLTAAHCTFDRTQVNHVLFFQPSFFAGDQIGTEAAVPAYRSGLFVPNGYFSDVAFVRARPGVPLEGKMTSADNCRPPSWIGDCVENGIINNITRSVSFLAVNTSVFKTGQTTGTSAGRISDACSDRVGEDGRRNLCQSIVSRDPAIPTNPGYLAHRGDSGSPVLLREGIPGTEAGALAGVLWGGFRIAPSSDDIDPDRFIFSPWQNIWQRERAGTRYGLAVTVVTAAHGVVSNPVPPPPPPRCPPPGEPGHGEDPNCPL